MKINHLTYLLLLLIQLFVYPALRSQDLASRAVRERLQVCTDRTMFVAGETVNFSVILFFAGDTAAADMSQAIYIELITPHGDRITGRKYLLKNSSARGSLMIPEETISGIYYLKAYTRFMRNSSTDTYKYIMLKIINPYKTDVLSGHDVIDSTTNALHHTGTGKDDLSLNFIPGKRSFTPREGIRFNITGHTEGKLPSRLCVSVVPASTFDEPVLPPVVHVQDTVKTVYYPETRGITLSGQLIGKDSRKPVPGAKVNLSIIGDKDILVVRTDSTGRFFFALPDYFGKMDIFLSADDLPGITPELLIDNDFCSRPVSLLSPLFRLDKEEQRAAYKLAVNARITSVFKQDTLRNDTLREENYASFYGKPVEILLMAKFIDLPTLAEYFTELPGMVKLKKVHGSRQFRFYDAGDEMSMYAPLMLVDWVAVNDIEKILAMSPGEIDRLELVNSLYVKGNITYGGIISFVSKKNNFAGIDLPTSGTFVNYMFLDDNNLKVSSAPATVYTPDSRNTLYWNPDLQTTAEGSAEISFTAPDTPGNYWILIRRMIKNGEVITYREMIEVTK